MTRGYAVETCLFSEYREPFSALRQEGKKKTAHLYQFSSQEIIIFSIGYRRLDWLTQVFLAVPLSSYYVPLLSQIGYVMSLCCRNDRNRERPSVSLISLFYTLLLQIGLYQTP